MHTPSHSLNFFGRTHGHVLARTSSFTNLTNSLPYNRYCSSFSATKFCMAFSRNFRPIAFVSEITYLLTYLIAHNNPTNGLPQHILPGASCAPTPVAYTNRWQGFLDLVFPTDARSSSSPTAADPRIKYPSRRSILLHTNDMVEPAQPLNINTLHNVHVAEELIQLTIESNAEINFP